MTMLIDQATQTIGSAKPANKMKQGVRLLADRGDLEHFHNMLRDETFTTRDITNSYNATMGVFGKPNLAVAVRTMNDYRLPFRRGVA